MGTSIGIYGTENDCAALNAYIGTLGLVLVPPSLDRELERDAEVMPMCFISLLPRDALHPYGKSKAMVSDATDPLMRYMRPFHKAPYLVAGHVYWNNDVNVLAERTKPSFNKIRKWITSNWQMLPGKGFWAGPEADRLMQEGAETVNVLPGTVTAHIQRV